MKKITDEDFVALYYEADSPRAAELREQLQASPQLQAQYQALSEALDQMREAGAPALAPHEKVEQFEAAWAKAGPNAAPWYYGLLHSAWKTSSVFVIGMICGIVVTMNAPAQQDHKSESRQQPVLEVQPVNNPLVIEQFDAFQTVRGEALDMVYSNIEDPVLVIDSSDPKGEKKVIHGTSENGAIQVVLNL
ncbi:MAG: hypothetical protein P9L94_18905 [Candidatus Hinthialibacter antarcticus]|nr:hypothetical protein [Candidatus Hinthialibacter antarcticus]